MMHVIILTPVFFFTLMAGSVLHADEADVFFDDSYVHEIRLYLDDPDWYNSLFAGHAFDPEDPLFPARFVYGDVVIDPVGVRFKGNSSFRISGVKKSFKIDFNEYADQVFCGLKKLNLNNGFRDPTILREKLFLDFAGRYVPTIRAVHTRLYVNDEYWGLYLAVEQVDKTFVQSRFGNSEDGNLFKGESVGSGFGSDLTWLGMDPEPYFHHYVLETNQTENDWSGLIHFIDVLNNGTPETFVEELEAVFDVDSWAKALALNILFVNLDSYCGSAHNYFLYDRDDTGRFTHLFWDTNEAFGSFLFGIPPWENPLTIGPFWMPETPPFDPPAERPLMERFWEIDAYERRYLRYLAHMLREGFNPEMMSTRIKELARVIRDDVYADSNKPYTNEQFEIAMTEDIVSGMGPIYGLGHFVEERSDWLDRRLDEFASRSDLRFNELMPVNDSTASDEASDCDPWVEIYNTGPGRVTIQGVFMTDDPNVPTKWALPLLDLDDGQFLLLWIDGEVNEGPRHAPFSLDPVGGELCLFKQEGANVMLIDDVTYPSLDADISYGRFPDGEGEWQKMDCHATPSVPNEEDACMTATLFINEFMADNDSTIEDPDEPGAFEDWIEICNPGPDAVDLGGMYLTDDLTDQTRYKIPAGVIIGPGGYMLFWADGNPEQGPAHTDFKLSATGEEIGLYTSDGVTEVDSVVFGQQVTDISWGRLPDGSETWQSFIRPTPGTTNSSPRLSLHSPENWALISSPPTFSWTGAGYDLFGLYLLLPIAGEYRPIGDPFPTWTLETSLDISSDNVLWKYMDQDTWASWAVIGIDTTTWDWQIAGPHWFMKVPAHGITSQVPGGRLPGSNSLLR